MQNKRINIDKTGGQVTPLKIKTFRLSDYHIRIGLRFGNGILSDGVRLALEQLNNGTKKP